MSGDLELWDWSLSIYRRSGVPARCLALQEELGFDVNVALACVWAATRGWGLAADDLRSMLEATAVARGRVEQLRTIRKGAKGDAQAVSFYEKLKSAELAGEKVVQTGLHRWLIDNPRPSGDSRRQRAEQSLERYAEHLRRWPDASEALRAFLDAVS